MRINTNVSSLTAQEASQNTSKRITSSLEKLSTGLRINKASDDASGLSIADKLRTQATSINQGIANGNSAVSLLQIADKSMAEQSNILDTIKAKLIQANTDTTSADGREAIRKDVSKLLEQLDNIAEQTNYNGNVLLQKSASDTSSSNALGFQIGETNNDTISNDTIQSNTSGLGSKVTYSADKQNNTIGSNATTTIASEGTISLTSTSTSGANAEERVSLSGDVDTLTLKAGMTISGMDSATKDVFENDSGLVLDTDYTQSGSTYTMINAKTLDLSGIDNVTATITTPAEAGGEYFPKVGDIVESTAQNDGSELATSLASGAWQDNGNGTYTATSAAIGALTGGKINLEAGESVDVESASNTQTFTAGQQITLSSNVTEGSNFATQLAAAVTAGTATLSGTAGTSGAIYTASGAGFTADVAFGENYSVFTPTPITIAIGDVIDKTGGTVVGSSALSDLLTNDTKFTDNADGTYTSLVAVSVNLAATEDVDLYAKTTLSTTFAFGDTVSVDNTNADALQAGSDLHTLLTDTNKFTKTTDGTTDNYKYIGSADLVSSTDLNAKEDVSLLKAVSTTIGVAKENSTLTLTSDVIPGSDLALQLADLNLFTKGPGTAGASGTTYTVNEDFSTDKIKTIEGEGFTITSPLAVDVQASISAVTANSTLMTDAIVFTADDATTTSYDVDTGGTTPANVGNLIAEGAGDDSTEATFSKSGYLAVGLSFAGAGATPNALATAEFAYAVGDRVDITTITNGATGSMSEEILEGAKWELVSGTTYQATATGSFAFDEAGDAITVQRRITANTPTDSTANTAAASSTNDKVDKTATTAVNVLGTTLPDSIVPDAKVSVNFTTGSTVNVTNSGLAANTLTMSGEAGKDISNGGTQLSALADVGAGQFTQDMADTFQAVVDDAITGLNGYRGDIGSTQNQVESAVRNLMTQATNVKAAESIIRDVDYAQESANFNKQNIISQAGSYAISQANTVQQNVLRLLQ